MFQVGDRVELVNCNDQHTDLKPGDQGVVDFIDDLGTVFVAWDGGSHLGMVAEAGDEIKIVPTRVVSTRSGELRFRDLEVKDQPVRTFFQRPSKDSWTELLHSILARTTCRWGIHSDRDKWVYKFNGGRGAWLCRYCRLILKYGHDREGGE